MTRCLWKTGLRARFFEKAEYCAGGGNSIPLSNPEESQPAATEDHSEEEAYLELLFSGSEAQQKKYEEENKQVSKMFEEFRNSSAAASLVSYIIIDLYVSVQRLSAASHSDSQL